MCTLVIEPEDFDRYEYDLNCVQAKEAELEQETIQDFLEFMRECSDRKVEILKRLVID